MRIAAVALSATEVAWLVCVVIARNEKVGSTVEPLVQGASARDTLEGDRTAQVYACQPAYSFVRYGLQGCNVSTSRPGNDTIPRSACLGLAQMQHR